MFKPNHPPQNTVRIDPPTFSKWAASDTHDHVNCDTYVLPKNNENFANQPKQSHPIYFYVCEQETTENLI